jgi:hypothetical protein
VTLRREGSGDFGNRRWTTTLEWAGLGQSGPCWPGCGWAGFVENKREWGGLLEGFWAQLTMGCKIDFKDLDSKTKRFKHFQTNIELD